MTATFSWGTVRAGSLQKRGSAETENEDAIAVSQRPLGPWRFAVSDGASQSAFARLWARLVASAYVAGNLPGTLEEPQLDDLRRRWHEEVSSKPRPWFVAMKAQEGAFATLLGLTLRPDSTWEATAVGDSYLFLVRQGRVWRRFPSDDPTAFARRPYLICSRADRNRVLADHVRTARGLWTGGDRFLLMTDALAAWFHDHAACGASPLPDLGDLLTEAVDFASWLGEQRDAGVVRNDDVSLVVIDVESCISAQARAVPGGDPESSDCV